MRVLYIHQYFTTTSGATGTRSYELAKALIQAGHQVTMLCGSNQLAQTGLTTPFVRGIRRGLVEGIQVIEIDLAYSNHHGFLKRLWKFLLFSLKSSYLALKLEYDVVYATSTPLTVGLPGMLAKKIRRKKFVFEVRDLWPELPVAMGIIKNKLFIRLLSGFEKQCYKTADHCVALSPGIAEGILKTGLPPQQVSMIPNGSDIDLFQNIDPILLAKYQEQLKGYFWCAFTGAHGFANGLGAVLNAAKVLKQKKQDQIRFLFVGEGKEKPQLIKRAKEEGLDNCIFWDPLPKKELAAVLQVVDLGLMVLKNVPAFYYGTSPNKFFDYLAAGLPILVNYPGWMANMIVEAESGFAVTPDDPTEFSEVLINISQQKKLLLPMKQNALNLALHDFDRKLLVQNILNLSVFQHVA